MSKIVIIGGGVAGLTGAMLLARDGHRVTLLERDPASPCAPRDAWSQWERHSLNQFRLPHAFLARFRQTLDRELPDVVAALESNGALRLNLIKAFPPAITGGWRDGDERFDQITGRRPMMEATLANLVAIEPGTDVRRGVAVTGLLTDDARTTGGTPHVTGVVTDDGQTIRADLVVDAAGRRSNLPDLLTAIGARRPLEQRADSGFTYYARHFRSSSGALPALRGSLLQHHDSVSTLTAPADNGFWSVVLFMSSGDRALRGARDVDVWERIVASYPTIAHWTDAEAVTGIDRIAKIEDRVRHFTVDGAPLVTGVVAIGDAWACTAPTIGRGASIAVVHVTRLRDVVRDIGTAEAHELCRSFHHVTADDVKPLVDDTLRVGRHRLAQIEAQIAGRTYETDDPAWRFGTALRAAASSDPDLLRAAMTIEGLLVRGVDVAGRPEVLAKLRNAHSVPLPGPTRAELLEIVERSPVPA